MNYITRKKSTAAGKQRISYHRHGMEGMEMRKRMHRKRLARSIAAAKKNRQKKGKYEKYGRNRRRKQPKVKHNL